MDCTCGDNPNCYRCDGSGLIKSLRSNHIIKGTGVKSVTRTKRHKNSNACKNLKNHSSSAKVSDSIMARPNLVICPYCKIKVNLKKINKHKAKCIQNPATLKVRNEPGREMVSGFMQCPHCKLAIKSKLFKKHIKSACRVLREKVKMKIKEQLAELRKGKSGKAKKKKPAKRHFNIQKPSKSKSNPNIKYEKFDASMSSYHSQYILDGSNGLHVARDNGKFGSYSSHDDYGEESNY